MPPLRQNCNLGASIKFEGLLLLLFLFCFVFLVESRVNRANLVLKSKDSSNLQSTVCIFTENIIIQLILVRAILSRKKFGVQVGSFNKWRVAKFRNFLFWIALEDHGLSDLDVCLFVFYFLKFKKFKIQNNNKIK